MAFARFSADGDMSQAKPGSSEEGEDSLAEPGVGQADHRARDRRDPGGEKHVFAAQH